MEHPVYQLHHQSSNARNYSPYIWLSLVLKSRDCAQSSYIKLSNLLDFHYITEGKHSIADPCSTLSKLFIRHSIDGKRHLKKKITPLSISIFVFFFVKNAIKAAFLLSFSLVHLWEKLSNFLWIRSWSWVCDDASRRRRAANQMRCILPQRHKFWYMIWEI